MRTRHMTIGALVALAGATGARAQEWIATAPGNWNDPAKWSGGVPNGVGASASIISSVQGGSLTTGGTFTFSAPVTIGSLTVDMGFGAPSVFFAPSVLTLDNGGGADVTIFTDATLNVDIGGSIVLMGNLVTNWRASNGQISGSISGDYGVIHDTPFEGRLRLYGNNTYTGPTIIRSGRISVREASGLGGPESATTVEAAGTLILESNSNPTINAEPVEMQNNARMYIQTGNWAGPITIVGSARITPWFDSSVGEVSGLLTGDGVFKRMSGQSWITNDETKESILTLSNGANAYTGGTVLEGGVLQVFEDGALGMAGTGISFNKDGFHEGSTALATMADVEIPRNITLVDQKGWLRADAGTTGTFSGVISGSWPLEVGFLDWSGTVALAGENTYTGGTTVRTGTLLANNASGSATGPGAVTVDPGAAIGGTGSIAGDVVLAGATVAPGASAGTLTVGGLSMDSASTMAIEIGGAGAGAFDRLVSNGPVTLAGTLTAALIDAYALQEGDEFEIVSAPSITGSFDAVEIGENLEMEVTATTVTLRAVNIAPACPADLSGDGFVDGADLGLLLGAWGGAGDPDLSGDGVVDGADLGLLLGSWGACP